MRVVVLGRPSADSWTRARLTRLRDDVTAALQDLDLDVVLDWACPGADLDAVAEGRAQLGATSPGWSVATRPITDTMKRLVGPDLDQSLGETVDRAEHVQVCAPLIVRGFQSEVDQAVAADLDVAQLVAVLARHTAGALWTGPPGVRRLSDATELAMLKALTDG